jgi:hypothetical protein
VRSCDICSVFKNKQRPNIQKGAQITEFKSSKVMKAIKVVAEYGEWQQVENLEREFQSDNDILVYRVDMISLIIATEDEDTMNYVLSSLDCLEKPIIETLK